MSDRGVRWLTALEGGVKLKAYLDSRGIPTIGVGQTTIIAKGGERRVELGDAFGDVGAAVESFRNRLKRDEVGVDAVTRDDIEQNAFDAFVSARFNIGPAFDRATFVALFNQRALIRVVADSLKANYHRAGEDAHALDSRRQAEADVLCLGVYHDQGGRMVA